MVDGVVGEGDEEVVHEFLPVDAGVLHEDGSHRIEYLDDQVEGVLVPLVLGGKFRLPE